MSLLLSSLPQGDEPDGTRHPTAPGATDRRDRRPDRSLNSRSTDPNPASEEYQLMLNRADRPVDQRKLAPAAAPVKQSEPLRQRLSGTDKLLETLKTWAPSPGRAGGSAGRCWAH